jgi:hypothetical protein
LITLKITGRMNEVNTGKIHPIYLYKIGNGREESTGK